MQSEDIRRAVRATIEAIAPGTDVARLVPYRPLREQIALDSMDWLNVVVDLHERLSLEIPESDYGRLATLDSMVAYLASRPSQPPARTPGPARLPCATRLVNAVPVTIRPVRAEDAPLEAEFVRHLSRDARYERFMLTLNDLSPAKLKYLTDVDQVRHVALVATVDRGGQPVLVGVVRYVVDAAGTGCEFAVAVDDAWHGSGLAGILMHDLMDIARSRGLASMEGIVLATNARMLGFARQLGFRQERDPEALDIVRVVRSL